MAMSSIAISSKRNCLRIDSITLMMEIVWQCKCNSLQCRRKETCMKLYRCDAIPRVEKTKKSIELENNIRSFFFFHL